MESFLIKALQLIVSLSLLVFIHEFGHYIFARMFGMKVSRFYLFFNPWFSLLKYHPDKGRVELIAWTKKTYKETVNDKGKTEREVVSEEPRSLISFKTGKPKSTTNKKGRPSWAATMYGIGWLPLGGYCDIAGMIDETTTADQLSKDPEPWEFRAKPAWQRLLVMIAGVLFNFILAIMIYIGMAWYWGEKVIPYQDVKEGMDYAEQFHKIGLEDGDVLLTLNGKPIDVLDPSHRMDMVQDGARIGVLRNGVDTVEVTVPKGFMATIASEKQLIGYRFPVIVDKVMSDGGAAEAGLRPGDRIVKIANDTTPSITEFQKALVAHKDSKVSIMVIRDGETVMTAGTISDAGKLGFQFKPITDIYTPLTIHYDFFESIPRGWEIGTTTLGSYVSSLKLLFTKDGATQVGGFGAIGSMFGDEWNWQWFWNITAFLSVILAFMNILPIPALDGGHVLFTLYEIITRRKPSEKFLGYAQMIGMAFLLLLLVYANGNDLIRWIRG